VLKAPLMPFRDDAASRSPVERAIARALDPERRFG
jgi:hypothetical protein